MNDNLLPCANCGGVPFKLNSGTGEIIRCGTCGMRAVSDHLGRAAEIWNARIWSDTRNDWYMTELEKLWSTGESCADTRRAARIAISEISRATQIIRDLVRDLGPGLACVPSVKAAHDFLEGLE